MSDKALDRLRNIVLSLIVVVILSSIVFLYLSAPLANNLLDVDKSWHSVDGLVEHTGNYGTIKSLTGTQDIYMYIRLGGHEIDVFDGNLENDSHAKKIMKLDIIVNFYFVYIARVEESLGNYNEGDFIVFLMK